MTIFFYLLWLHCNGIISKKVQEAANSSNSENKVKEVVTKMIGFPFSTFSIYLLLLQQNAENDLVIHCG